MIIAAWFIIDIANGANSAAAANRLKNFVIWLSPFRITVIR